MCLKLHNYTVSYSALITRNDNDDGSDDDDDDADDDVSYCNKTDVQFQKISILLPKKVFCFAPLLPLGTSSLVSYFASEILTFKTRVLRKSKLTASPRGIQYHQGSLKELN